MGELEANQHQGRLTRTLVPSRHVHKEIPGGVDGGVDSVDDGWKRKDVVVGVEDQGITVHALEEVGIINAFGVVEQDVIDAHGLVVGERYKLVRSIDGHHGNGGASWRNRGRRWRLVDDPCPRRNAVSLGGPSAL